jgi:Uma2 family endonuclease
MEREMATRPLLTAEEFLVHPAAREHSELVRGEVRVMSPASGANCVVTTNVVAALSAHVRTRGLGQCFADGTGFRLPIPGAEEDTLDGGDVLPGLAAPVAELFEGVAR